MVKVFVPGGLVGSDLHATRRQRLPVRKRTAGVRPRPVHQPARAGRSQLRLPLRSGTDAETDPNPNPMTIRLLVSQQNRWSFVWKVQSVSMELPNSCEGLGKVILICFPKTTGLEDGRSESGVHRRRRRVPLAQSGVFHVAAGALRQSARQLLLRPLPCRYFFRPKKLTRAYTPNRVQ